MQTHEPALNQNPQHWDREKVDRIDKMKQDWSQ